ncbi:MAG: hypothetical protein QW568_04870 [Candidatus Anstonellaceae archaeon]
MKLTYQIAAIAALLILAFATPLFGLPNIVPFILSILVLMLSASALGHATEELAGHYNQTVGGLLNATFGNMAELIIAFFAIQKGLVEVVKASITGSFLGNVLLVFGLAAIAGGIKRKEMAISQREGEINSTMLLIAVLIILFPSLLFIFHEQQYERDISLIAAVMLIALYLLSLLFSFFTHREWFLSMPTHKPSMKKRDAFLLMLFCVAAIAISSEKFAGILEEVAHQFSLGELFVGAVLIGFAGNAAEHLVAIKFAQQNKMSLVLSTTVGSSLQIAMFVAPPLACLASVPVAFLPSS